MRPMRRLSSPLVLAIVLSMSISASGDSGAGWKPLFDGKTTAGWRGYRKQHASGAWKVQGGALVLQAGGERGDLITTAQYGSFELSLEWKVAAGGNSGVIYLVQETEAAPWMTGPELQILDNQRHPDGKSPLTSAGACYGLYPPGKDVSKPAGQWNRARLVVDGDHVEHWLNGEKLLAYQRGSADWKARVAASKFKRYPNFGTAERGFIALQDHGDAVEYRNIVIRAAH
jgi:3-keto-disaccharide hydrolase